MTKSRKGEVKIEKIDTQKCMTIEQKVQEEREFYLCQIFTLYIKCCIT